MLTLWVYLSRVCATSYETAMKRVLVYTTFHMFRSPFTAIQRVLLVEYLLRRMFLVPVSVVPNILHFVHTMRVAEMTLGPRTSPVVALTGTLMTHICRC